MYVNFEVLNKSDLEPEDVVLLTACRQNRTEDLGKYIINRKIFLMLMVYVFNEISIEYNIDTWWIGYDKEDAYETHVYKYNKDLLIAF